MTKKEELIKELKKGEKSAFEKDFDRQIFLDKIHQKHDHNRWCINEKDVKARLND